MVYTLTSASATAFLQKLASKTRLQVNCCRAARMCTIHRASSDETVSDAKSHAHRKFYDLSEAYASDRFQRRITAESLGNDEALLNYIRDGVIGKDAKFEGPFGRRKGMHIYD